MTKEPAKNPAAVALGRLGVMRRLTSPIPPKPNNMKTHIDLTSPAKAISYLRSLPASTEVEIIDARRTLPNAETDAVAAIVGGSAFEWANSRSRWNWTAAELVAALAESSACYLVASGWVSENKHHGCGDGETTSENFFATLAEAEAAFDAAVASDGKTSDRGDRWVRHTVDIFQADENGEFTVEVKSFRSEIPASN